MLYDKTYEKTYDKRIIIETAEETRDIIKTAFILK